MTVRIIFLQNLAEGSCQSCSSQFDRICSSPKLLQSPECIGRLESGMSWLSVSDYFFYWHSF